ncbi:hypothetical protein J1N35_022033 [Gossypium stocksii]|uniref:Uncharacterized protein n=1 Tax=Gossypium stocksii TaxID=47602 RepID=A0A9D3VHE5_9ROSI|nr:hypothetical protein J1N35_022033 [Gossypium stocksii]
MKMAPAPPNKSTKAKVKNINRPIKWKHRLSRDVRYNIRLLESMKIGMDIDSSEGKEGVTEPKVEKEEEIDDEATEDGDFASYQGNLDSAFSSTRQPRGGPVFRDPSDQPWMQPSRPTVSRKGKRIVGISECFEDDSDQLHQVTLKDYTTFRASMRRWTPELVSNPGKTLGIVCIALSLKDNLKHYITLSS